MKKAFLFCLFALIGMAQGMWAQTTVYNENGLNSAITNGANIVLGNDITLTNWVIIDAPVTVSIDLNGHKLNRGNPAEADGYGHVLIIGGGANVTIKDSSTGGTGQITGGNADAGGGIWIGPQGTVTLQGGTITGCHATGNGGGIYNKGTLTISGGAIKENTAGGEGGGIYLGAGGTLYLSGNLVVKDNTTNGLPQNLYLNGMRITCNGAFTDGAKIHLTPTMVDGALTTNYGTYNGSTDPNTFLKLDGSIGSISLNTGVTPAEACFSFPFDYITDVMLIGAGKSINTLKAEKQAEGWTLVDKDLNAGAGGAYVFLLYKTKSSPGSSGLPITDFYVKISGSSGHPETITSNGHTYTLTPGGGNSDFNNGGRDLNRSAGGNYIHLYYTKETVSPARALTGITIDGNSTGAVVANGGTSAADLNSGAGGDDIYMHAIYSALSNPIYVTTEEELRYAVTLNGAYIVMQDDIMLSKEIVLENTPSVTLDLNGHTLNRGLSSAASYGHVLKIMSGSALAINDTSGNNSGVIKGGYTGSGGALNNYGTLTINGGTIKDNNTDGNGAGIINQSSGVLTINGGKIIQNHAKSKGGGIYNEGTLYMSGKPVVNLNTVGDSNESDNVYLPTGKTVNVAGAFTQEANICIKSEANGQLTTGYSTYNGSGDPKRFFKTDVATDMTIEDGEVFCTLLPEYITDVKILRVERETNLISRKNEFMAKDWRIINQDLNADAGGFYLYLGYKTQNSPESSGNAITGFTILKYDNQDTTNHPTEVTCDGNTYYLVVGEGDTYSWSHYPDKPQRYGTGEDLNCNTSGDRIYLYYTKAINDNVVSRIYFNDNKSGAVGLCGADHGWDLNSGLARGAYGWVPVDDIYMHYETINTTMPSVFTIADATDWSTFCTHLNDKTWNRFVGKTVKLVSDIGTSENPIATMAGDDRGFGGTFDGQGHTITVNLSNNVFHAALFPYINGATIKNLTVAGTVTGSNHSAAIVGYSMGTGNRLQDCTATATVSGGNYIGGLVGHAQSSDIIIENCRFSGLLTGNTMGDLLGWADNGGTKTISNSLYEFQPGQGTDGLDLARISAGTVTINKCYKTVDAGSLGLRVYTAQPDDDLTHQITLFGTNFWAPAIVNNLKPVYDYTGLAIDLGYTVTDDDGNVLTPGTDYTATITTVGADPVPAHTVNEVIAEGNYTLALAGMGSYAGTKSIAFSVKAVPPYKLATTNVSYTGATVTWMGEQQQFNLRWRKVGSDEWQTAANVNATSTQTDDVTTYSYALTGLATGTAYEWQVQGIYSDDTGEHITDWSESGFFTTDFDLTLANNTDNSSAIATNAGKIGNVTLQGYTLYKDGSWNTLCLPFDVATLEGSPLEGATIKALESSTFNGDTGKLILNFTADGNDLKAIEAGKPYIVKWATAGEDVSNPVFNNVTISNSTITNVETACADFIGSYAPFSNVALLRDANNTNGDALHAALNLHPTKSGYTIDGWYIDADRKNAANAIPFAADGTVTLYATWKENDRLELADAENIENTISEAAESNKIYNVKLTDRTLYTDGDWNTLCLPFSVALEGSPLEGWTVKTLESTSFTDGTLTLTFSDAVGGDLQSPAIEAGKPYIVKWNPHLEISTLAQWNAFASSVNNGTETYEGKTVRLTADISNIKTMVGTEEYPFMGTFDGQGHTLNLNLYDTYNQGTAPFHYISGATIANVKTTGSVKGHVHCAGLVGFAWSGTNTIKNCEVAATVDCYFGNHTHCGGILGHGKASTTTITDCLFSGTVKGAATATGVIYGWGDNPGVHTIKNCMANGSYSGKGIDLMKGSGTQDIDNCYKNTSDYTQGEYTTATGNALVEILGTGWKESDGRAVPQITDTHVNIVSPVFNGVTVSTTTAPVETASVDFIGITSPVTLTAGDRTKLYLGAANTLYYPSADVTINSCRAYFQLNGDITAGGHEFSRIVLNFGDDSEASGITTTDFTDHTDKAGAWYDLSGRRLDGKPSRAGIYINNGKKVVIK